MQSKDDLTKAGHAPYDLAWRDRVEQLLEHLHLRFGVLEGKLALSVEKDAYTVQETAERLNRSDWTVRQWCNKGLVPGAKKVRGKGRTGEWRIPHASLVKLQNDGPLPLGGQP